MTVIMNWGERFYLGSFTIVRLCLVVSASVTPIASVSLSSRANFHSRPWPEPSVFIWWLQIYWKSLWKPIQFWSFDVLPGRSHPAKLHFLPEVQMYLIFPRAILCLMNSFSCGVSRETASIQCLRQMLRASNQSTSKLLVGWCSQLKKYEWATPRASL